MCEKMMKKICYLFLFSLPALSACQKPCAKMGNTVFLHYHLSDVSKNRLDESYSLNKEERKCRNSVFKFVMGRSEMYPWFENAVSGMHEDEHKTVVIKSEEAFGNVAIPNNIPAGTDLILELEILEIR